MPTDEQNTVPLTKEQKDWLAKMPKPEGHGLPAGGKDPAHPHPHPHPHPHMRESGVDQHDDKQF